MVPTPEPVIIIENREWCPFPLSGPTIRGTLPTGDYSLAGYENIMAIERKTLNDLVMCLGPQRDRFKRELQRGMELEFFAVIIESSFEDLTSWRYRSRLHPNSAVESISTFEIRYRIPFLFCGTRALAGRKCESLLRKFYREKMLELDEWVPF
jgi:DNA excision repair protein ERCC-4